MARTQIPLFNQYLDTDCGKERQQLLIAMWQNGSRLPFGMVKDLLNYDLAHGEHALLLKLAELPANDHFESFLTEGYFRWDQNVVSAAIAVWAEKTQHNYWQLGNLLAASPAISQRISYTLLDHAWQGDGGAIIAGLATQQNLDNMATVYYNLLLTRALQWQIRLPAIAKIAESICQQSISGDRSIEKGALLPALCYYRYTGATLPLHQLNTKLTEIWRSYLTFLDHSFMTDAIAASKAQLLTAVEAEKPLKDVLAFWLHCQQRHVLTADDVAALYGYLAKAPQPVAHWQLFTGIESTVLMAALERLPAASQVDFVATVGSLISGKQLHDWVCAQQASHRSRFPQRYVATQFNDPAATPKAFFARQPKLQLVEALPPRSAFFDVAYAGDTRGNAEVSREQLQPPAGSRENHYWHSLKQAWEKPDPKALGPLSEQARQQPKVWQLAYIDTLGQFTGCDEAVLKLLDYIRSSDQTVLSKVVSALHRIGTPRATQELIHFLTRSNVTFAVQMDIVAQLGQADLSLLQKELRSALVDLTSHAALNQQSLELQEALANLLTTKDADQMSKVLEQPLGEDHAVTTEQLDTILGGQLNHYGDLPSECKRAFRTALFFDQQVSRSKHLTTIDLSPAIDMQYKALELLFRDVLEESCLRLIQSGILQKKLDVIGYARPIPAAMEKFENYIASLPIVKDIPFFSRFKLRKMLRAICQYRKGKRFTLDGLKAFCLFMLCFGRKDCPYQMADIYHLEGFSDEQLFAFCKRLHEYQDFRNRAAHEGFHPGKSNNLDDIWAETAAIVRELYSIDTMLIAARTPQNSQLGRAG